MLDFLTINYSNLVKDMPQGIVVQCCNRKSPRGILTNGGVAQPSSPSMSLWHWADINSPGTASPRQCWTHSTPCPAHTGPIHKYFLLMPETLANLSQELVMGKAQTNRHFHFMLLPLDFNNDWYQQILMNIPMHTPHFHKICTSQSLALNQDLSMREHGPWKC